MVTLFKICTYRCVAGGNSPPVWRRRGRRKIERKMDKEMKERKKNEKEAIKIKTKRLLRRKC